MHRRSGFPPSFWRSRVSLGRGVASDCGRIAGHKPLVKNEPSSSIPFSGPPAWIAMARLNRLNHISKNPTVWDLDSERWPLVECCRSKIMPLKFETFNITYCTVYIYIYDPSSAILSNYASHTILVLQPSPTKIKRPPQRLAHLAVCPFVPPARYGDWRHIWSPTSEITSRHIQIQWTPLRWLRKFIETPHPRNPRLLSIYIYSIWLFYYIHIYKYTLIYIYRRFTWITHCSGPGKQTMIWTSVKQHVLQKVCLKVRESGTS